MTGTVDRWADPYTLRLEVGRLKQLGFPECCIENGTMVVCCAFKGEQLSDVGHRIVSGHLRVWSMADAAQDWFCLELPKGIDGAAHLVRLRNGVLDILFAGPEAPPQPG